MWNDGKRLAVHGHCEGLVTASPRRPFLIAESKLLSVRLNTDKALKAPMKFDLDLVGEDKPQLVEIRNGVLIHEDAPAEKGNTRVVTVDRNSFIDAVQGRHVNGSLSGDDATFLERFGSLFEAPRTRFPLEAPGSR